MTKLSAEIRMMLFFALTVVSSVAAGSTCLAVQDTADKKLEKAREDLRLSLVTQQRIAQNIQALKRSGNATPEILKEYQTYLENVALMVEENRRIVKSMEAAYTRRGSAKEAAGGKDLDSVSGIVIPEEKAVDDLTALDRELDASLAAFDDMLLKELELIRAASAEKMRDFALEAADAARRLKEKEGGPGESDDPSRKASGKSAPDQEPYDLSGRKKDTPAETAGHGQDLSRPGKKGETRSGAERRSPAGEQDDDIVARQLREAAENETDPELREKLWKKYREYKNSTRN